MKLDLKVKRRPRFSLFAYVIWPCGDTTQHEILSEAICPFALKRIFWLATPYGPICRSWRDISFISNSSYRPRGWKDTPDWTSSEGECRVRKTTRKETK